MAFGQNGPANEKNNDGDYLATWKDEDDAVLFFCGQGQSSQRQMEIVRAPPPPRAVLEQTTEDCNLTKYII